MPTTFIADAGPDEVVVYAVRGAGLTAEHARYDRPRGPQSPGLDQLIETHGWYRLRAWRAPHEAPDHLVAQVTPWSSSGYHGTRGDRPPR